MKNYLIYACSFLLIAMFAGCNDDDEIQEEIFSVSNIIMTDLGQTTPKPQFLFTKAESSIKCEIRTNLIKKDDEIKEVKLISKGDHLIFNIITTPNNFECSDASCYSTHLITFNINKDLEKRNYKIELGFNNAYEKPFDYNFN